MNYWPAEVCNLPECHEPLFDLIEELAQNGRRTAEINYGCRGWTAHHNTDLWRQSAPVGDFGQGDPVWALWPMAGAWLCQHLWEHYLFGGDERFLKEKAYPLMKGAALFCLDWLIPDPQGRLVTAPSTSPEHKFCVPGGGKAAVSAGATMDIALISELFANVIEAASRLGEDKELRTELAAARERLLPLGIDGEGRLKEWAHDLQEEDRHHRHFSHLVGVYPGKLSSARPRRRSLRLRRVRSMPGETRGRAGASPGRSPPGPALATAKGRFASLKTSFAWSIPIGRAAEAASTPTSSAPILHFKSTGISASPRALRRCSCNRTGGDPSLARVCQKGGRMEVSKV